MAEPELEPQTSANGEWPGLSGTKDSKIAAWHAFELKKWPRDGDSSLDGCSGPKKKRKPPDQRALEPMFFSWPSPFRILFSSVYYLQNIMAIISFGKQMFQSLPGRAVDGHTWVDSFFLSSSLPTASISLLCRTKDETINIIKRSPM